MAAIELDVLHLVREILVILLIAELVHLILPSFVFLGWEVNFPLPLLSKNASPVALFDGFRSCVLKCFGEKSKCSKMCFPCLQVFFVFGFVFNCKGF